MGAGIKLKALPIPEGQVDYPNPLPHIKCRVLGPEWVNGMKTWRVFRYRKEYGRLIEEQVGDRCMTWEEVEVRVDDVLKNKTVVYVGPHRFEKKPLLKGKV